VRYLVSGPLSDIAACHCGQCRRWTGHYLAAAAARRGDLGITGRIAWYESSPGVRRGFCPACGTSLFWERRDEDRVWILAGGLDGPTGLRLKGHVQVAFKGDYYDIDDGLPQAAGRSAEILG
jgi:hypothetical protein